MELFLFFFFYHPVVYGLPSVETYACQILVSLSHCAPPGLKPVTQSSRDAANLFVPQWELLELLSFWVFLFVCLLFQKTMTMFFLHIFFRV